MDDIIKNEIKLISILDTVHDFKKELNNNKYYNNYVDTNISLNKLDPSIKNKSVEKYLLNKYDLNIDTSGVELNNFKETNIFNINNNFKKNNFKINFKSNDITSITFKSILKDICISSPNVVPASDINLGFITDTTIIPREILCALDKTSLLISDATYYDRATQLENDGVCVKKEDIVVRITRNNGHLMELDYIETGNGVIKYVLGGGKENIININDFIINDNKYGKCLTFYNNIISTFVDITKNKKDINRLNKLLDELERIYKLRINIFDNDKIQEDKVQQLCNVLFDFKRSGDHLQIISAKQNKNVFISNDRMSIILAYILDVPCVRTYANINGNDDNDGEDDDAIKKSRNRLLNFYNFDNNMIYNNILKDNDYLRKIYVKNIDKYNDYIKKIIILHDKLNELNIVNMNYMAIEDEKKREETILRNNINIEQIKDYLVFNIVYSSIIYTSSIFIIPNSEKQARTTRKSLSTTEEIDRLDYEHTYLNLFNILLNLILYLYIDIIANFENYKFKGDVYYDNDYNKYIQLLNNNMIFQLIEIVELDDNTIDFFVKIFNNIITFNFEEEDSYISPDLTTSKKRTFNNTPSPMSISPNEDLNKRTKFGGENKRNIIINNDIRIYTFNNNIRERYYNLYLKYKPSINILYDLSNIINLILPINNSRDIKRYNKNKTKTLFNKIKMYRKQCVLEVGNNFGLNNINFNYEQDNIFDEYPNFVFNAKYNINDAIKIKNMYESVNNLITIKYYYILSYINDLISDTYNFSNLNIFKKDVEMASPVMGGLNTPLHTKSYSPLHTPLSYNVDTKGNANKLNLKNLGYVGFLTSNKKDINDKLAISPSSNINKVLSYDDDGKIKENIKILKNMTYTDFINTCNKNIINDDKKDITIFLIIFFIKQFNMFANNKINKTIIKYYEYANKKIKNDI